MPNISMFPPSGETSKVFTWGKIKRATLLKILATCPCMYYKLHQQYISTLCQKLSLIYPLLRVFHCLFMKKCKWEWMKLRAKLYYSPTVISRKEHLHVLYIKLIGRWWEGHCFWCSVVVVGRNSSMWLVSRKITDIHVIHNPSIVCCRSGSHQSVWSGSNTITKTDQIKPNHAALLTRVADQDPNVIGILYPDPDTGLYGRIRIRLFSCRSDPGQFQLDPPPWLVLSQ